MDRDLGRSPKFGRLPIPGHEVRHPGCRRAWQPGKDIGEPGLRIYIVHLRGDDQGIHEGRAVPAALGAVVSTIAVLLIAVAGVVYVAASVDPARQHPRKYVGVLFAVMLSFYGPNVVAVSVILAAHSVLPSERAGLAATAELTTALSCCAGVSLWSFTRACF